MNEEPDIENKKIRDDKKTITKTIDSFLDLIISLRAIWNVISLNCSCKNKPDEKNNEINIKL